MFNCVITDNILIRHQRRTQFMVSYFIRLHLCIITDLLTQYYVLFKTIVIAIELKGEHCKRII